jgi:hypothetical protein
VEEITESHKNKKEEGIRFCGRQNQIMGYI